ncbi:MAG: VWA domain-containing protein [Candidatus Lokiarchaeota archaeon]|nr:VWA domain-containing protein [Candidatus Lokiarchaeota archaeon]
MTGKPIIELQKGVRLFLEELKADEFARQSVEICIVTFSSDVQQVVEFGSIDKVEPPDFLVGGWTHMGAGVDLALDLLIERKKLYSQAGISYHQPWMVLMSDGKPQNEPESVTQKAAKRTRELINDKKLVIFPIGVGPDADYEALSQFSPKKEPLKLQGLKFREFFEWLSESTARQSRSLPGEGGRLPTEEIDTWAQKGWDTFP